MDDIIIITSADFHTRKNSKFFPDNEIYREKYDKLFKEYICFSDTAVVVIQPNLPFKIIKKSYSNHNNKVKIVKTVKKYILGILNVINNENYKKMLLKIKIYINHDNIHEIFTEILDKSISQIFYIKIYINLMKDLVQSLSDIDKNVAIELINKFIAQYVDEKKYILDTLSLSTSYNDFCIIQKMKANILAKHSILLELLQHTSFVNHINMQNYSCLIYNSFMEYINKNNDIADIILQMLIELSKLGQRFNCESIKNIIIDNSNSKINFLIKDLLTMHSV